MVDKVYSLANQKGGVGKTTSCVNLAAALAARGERVLLLDMDPQGNASMGSGVNKHGVSSSMVDLLLGEAPLTQVIIPNTPAGYDLVPANSDLTAAEVTLLKRDERELVLRRALKDIDLKYDFVLIDCPPALNMLTLNALAASDGVIVPMQCEYFALEGLSDLLNTIKQIKQSINPSLEIMGIIRTMFDTRNRLCSEVSDQLIEHFGNKVFQTAIPRNVRLAEAPSHGLPIQLYDKSSRGAAAYMTLAAEVLRRHKQRYPKNSVSKVTVKTSEEACPSSIAV
jgi:chromosome partitioning protein